MFCLVVRLRPCGGTGDARVYPGSTTDVVTSCLLHHCDRRVCSCVVVSISGSCNVSSA